MSALAHPRRPRRLTLIASAALAACAAATTVPASADPPTACTEIGCSSRVSLDVAKVKQGVGRLTFCVRDRCQRVGVKKRQPLRGLDVVCDREITVRAVLIAKSSAGRRLARYTEQVPLKAVQPNGPGCPPTCFQGGVRFNGAELVVVS